MNDFWIKKFKEEALPKIIEEFHPKMVILFGSRITGEAREESDTHIQGFLYPHKETIPDQRKLANLLRIIQLILLLQECDLPSLL